MTTTEQLERLRRQPTRYELAATHPDGRRVLLAYSMRKSRSSMWNIVTEDTRREALIALVGGRSITFADRAADGATMGDWRIVWTGRTRRDAVISGESPFVCDVAPLEAALTESEVA